MDGLLDDETAPAGSPAASTSDAQTLRANSKPTGSRGLFAALLLSGIYLANPWKQ
jgi:hypothetical protein